MFDAVIFDLDGTLVDTERLAIAAGIKAFAAFGQPVDEVFLHSLIGKDGPTGTRLIAVRFPDLDVAGMDKVWSATLQQRIAEDGLPLKPGAAELLAALGLPRAVATSSGRASAAYKLAQAGLTQAFAHVVTLDDVAAAKPAPDAYLLAAARLGVAASRCVAFEDSDIGAQSAHAAGMRVIQVPDLLPTLGAFAHHVAPDLLSGARMAGLLRP